MKTIKQFDGFKLELDDHGSGNEKMLLHMDNPAADYLAKGFSVGPQDTVIDIGAHIGRFTLHAASRSARVYAYEPDPKNVEKLNHNIVLNNFDNIYVFQKAVNIDGKDVILYLSSSASENTLYQPSEKSLVVPATNLENIFIDNHIERCDFLKIDCEGAEYEILTTVPSKYFEKIDKIALEYHDHLYDKKSLKDLVVVLSRNGYKLWIQRGAWYTGILYARRSRSLFKFNYLRIFGIDVILFALQLVIKKMFKR